MANNIELTEAQKAAIDCIDGHLQIVACAGAGKTEVISRRIGKILQSKPGVKAENIVAFTFTEKAAEALKQRIETVAGENIRGMFIGTIHGFCKYLLSKYSAEFSEYKVLDTVKNHLFLNRYESDCGMKDLDLKPCLLNDRLFLQCIDKLIDDYDNREKWSDVNSNAFDKYISCLYKHKYIDFSLLIFEALRQIENNGATQEYLKKVKYLIVDEYQDVNDLQEKLIGTMAAYGANVCVVGDDDQTIYRFRGSNSENMIAFTKRYHGATKINLDENFRSQKGIVDIASKVIRHNEHRIPKEMISGAEECKHKISANGYASTDEELSAIAEKIEHLHKGGMPYKDIAVLVRKGKHIPAMTAKLMEKGIPYIADSAEEFFNGDYFKRFVETLKILENFNKAALYKQWCDIVDDEKIYEGYKHLRRCRSGGSYSLSDILVGFCDKIELLNDSASDLEKRKENLCGIVMILNDYDEIYGDYQLTSRIRGILRFLAEQAKKEYKYHNFRECCADEDAMQVMTVHKAKGLEFGTVFLPRLNEKEFPVADIGGKKYYHILGGTFSENKEKYSSDTDDERKLFYVAVTRAKKNLFLSYTLEKQAVSRFVSEAADSEFLQINRNDIFYIPTKEKYSLKTLSEEFGGASEDQIKAWEQDKAEKERYWEKVRYAREALFEEYFAANHFCKGIIMEFSEICKEGPEAILAKAREWGIN